MNRLTFNELKTICNCLDEKLKQISEAKDNKTTEGEFNYLEQLLDKCLEKKWDAASNEGISRLPSEWRGQDNILIN